MNIIHYTKILRLVRLRAHLLSFTNVRASSTTKALLTAANSAPLPLRYVLRSLLCLLLG